MLIPLRKSTGRTGAGISRSTVMKMPQGPFTIRCTGSYPKKIILYSRPMWTTVFRKRVLIKKRLFYTQGDYGLLQCCEPCHRQTYDNRALILRMVEEQKNMRIPTALIPRCPKCGKPMAVNLRSDDRFAEDEGWRKAAGRYADFLRRHDGMHILLWEIGVGYNTPGIIKYPFWQMTAQNPNAVYACLNSGQAVCPGAIQRQSICIDGDAGILPAGASRAGGVL